MSPPPRDCCPLGAAWRRGSSPSASGPRSSVAHAWLRRETIWTTLRTRMMNGKDEGQRRAVAQLQVGERIQVDVEDGGRRHVERLPVRHDVELVESEQRTDDADQGHEQDGPHGQRQGDAADALPVAGAVESPRPSPRRESPGSPPRKQHAEADHLPGDRMIIAQAAVWCRRRARASACDHAEFDQQRLMSPWSGGAATPEQARAPSPTTTGMKMTPRAKRLIGVLSAVRTEQIAADHQDRRDLSRVVQGVEERDPELAVVEGACRNWRGR